METPVLDEYIFRTDRRLNGCRIDSIEFRLRSKKEIDQKFVLSLFPSINISLIKIDKPPKYLDYKYQYTLIFNIKAEFEELEYATLVGKIFILSTRLDTIISTFGINA